MVIDRHGLIYYAICVIVHLVVLLETAVHCQFEFENPSTGSWLSHWQFSESSWRNSCFLFPFTKRQSITKAFVYRKEHANFVTHWGHDDWCRCTPEATLGDGESYLVKANAVDPKLWKVRETSPAQDIRWK